jgi:hypothetical protein
MHSSERQRNDPAVLFFAARAVATEDRQSREASELFERAVAGMHVGNRVVLSAAASPFPWVREVTQGISKSFKYSDLGTSWEYKERNAFFGAVDSKQ